MNKILTVEQAIDTSNKLRVQGKKIVLIGGCFDILHKGHITFLNHAKAAGDFLFVMLESDKNVRKIKGEKRPIHPQKKRALVLSSLHSVDYILLLPPFDTNQEYDSLVENIKPDILGITQGDPNRKHKDRQAKKINSSVIEVSGEIPEVSTTRLIEKIAKK